MQCPQCSHSVEGWESRCSRCGADLHLTEVPTLAETPKAPDAPTLDFPPGTPFAGRYTIIERIGQGGMGVVYKAIDTTLDHTVTLKLIQPSLASDPTFVQRFKREVRLTRQIAHPNVCRVHDIGDSDGILYLSMEWIRGETLRKLLNQAVTLEQDRALEIAEKIALALHAAHLKGIIHRDLKPENVMIDEQGEVFVMDFGLAVGEGPTDRDGKDAAVGTIPYMAPEQRRGERVDARADLFALGLILEEMLTGKTPDPAAGRSGLPPGSGARGQILSVLESLLAEEREKRLPSAGAAAQALRGVREGTAPLPVPAVGRVPASARRRWIGAGAVAGILLTAAAIAYSRRGGHGSGLSSPPALPRTTPLARTYFDRGVDYLDEEGIVRNQDYAIRFFNRSLKEDNGFAPAWAGLGEAYWFRYLLNRVPSSREEALRAVGKAIELGPDLPESYCARGVGYFVEADYLSAKAALEKAVAKRPDFDRAWSWLGTSYRELDDYSAGREALQRAILLKPGNAKYRLLLGNFLNRFKEYDEAGRAYGKAIELSPNSTTAWNNLGAMYLRLQRFGDAAEAFDRSLQVEERGSNYSNLGTAYYYQDKFEDAAAAYRRATTVEPKEARNWRNLGDALRMLGKAKESREAYQRAVLLQEEAVALKPRDALAHALLGLYCAKAKGERWKECAPKEAARATEMDPQNADIAFLNAIAQCILGRHQQALDHLEKAVRFGTSKVEIEHEPDLAPLRGDPRYRKILDLAS